MNNFNLQQNFQSSQLDSILDIITAEANVSPFGKKKRAKLRRQMRQRLEAAGHFPSTSNPKLEESESDYSDLPRMVGTSDTTQLNEKPVILTPSNCLVYDESLLDSKIRWHKVIIQHDRKFPKKILLQSLFHIVGPEFFAPFAYTEGREVDYFVVFNQGAALRRLFVANLTIRVKDSSVPLIVQLGVGLVRDNQPRVSDLMFDAIKARMTSGTQELLDLSHFSLNEELKDVTISLSNKATMKILADQLNGIEKLKEDFRVFKFDSNEINSLESFTKLFGFKMKNLDLRYNQIPSTDEFHFLKQVGEIEEISVAGNPFTKALNYREKIFEIMPNLQAVDTHQKLGGSSSGASVFVALKKRLEPTGSQKAIGNAPIQQIQDGKLIKRDPRRPEQFLAIKNSLSSFKDDSQWTLVTIQHKQLPKEEIFEFIVKEHMKQCPFFPCYYKRYGDRDEFFLYKNFEALCNLMAMNLECDVPPSLQTVVFSLRLNAAPFKEGQVDWFHKLIYVIKKRLTTETLDLDNFVSDPDFEKMMVPMGNKYTINFILDIARKNSSQLTKITAQNNGLESLEGFHSLNSFSKLVTLDLRNNKISALLGVSRSTNVKELLLDGNPICEKLSEPVEYVTEAKHFFTSLEYLDGHLLDSNLNLVAMQNFLVQRGAYTIADEFVQAFFNIYDSERHQIMNFYGSRSMFTMSCYYDDVKNAQVDNIYMRVQRYAKCSRNLIKVSNMNQITMNCFIGAEVIGRVLNDLPKTSHHQLSFCVDVPFYEPANRVVIFVSGTFEDHGLLLNETNFLVAFTRTFVLVPAENNQYFIANEQLSIHSPTLAQRDSSLIRKQQIKESFIETKCKDLLPTEIEEKEMKFLLFKELTELKKEECLRQLEESFWNVKVALATFNTLMDSGNMPDNKFDFK